MREFGGGGMECLAHDGQIVVADTRDVQGPFNRRQLWIQVKSSEASAALGWAYGGDRGGKSCRFRPATTAAR